MTEWFQMETWSPYAVGIGIGILSWLSFLLSDSPLSCSTALSQTSGLVERIFHGKKVMERDYYKEYPPVLNWKLMLLIGIVLGGFLAAKSANAFQTAWVPQLWAQTFGPALLPRLIVGFTGGVLMGFGSRFADGCTSGHGISGTLQLAASSWLSVVFFFIGGIVTAMLIYRVIGA